jgi:S1-C subfamily serine protease
MNGLPSTPSSWRYRLFHGPLVWLVILNIALFGLLLLRIVFGSLFGYSPSVLLIDGLNNQIGRLEVIAKAPCDAPELLQFQRGEIGPVQGQSPLGSDTLTAPDAAAKAENAPEPSNRMLAPDALRLLVHQSVVRVLADTASGTGFAIGPNLVVTNRHVIEEAVAGRIFVTSKFLGPEPVPAELVASSPDSTIGNLDFAVLIVRGGKSLVPLPVGSDPKPLDSVVAAGFPGLTVSSDTDGVSPDVVFSQGEVSVVQPQPNGVGLVIHTANIAPGSSGGPLLNRCGTLVGVNTFVSTGDQADGRALYSLSPDALAAYLTSVGSDFRRAPSDCVSGGA